MCLPRKKKQAEPAPAPAPQPAPPPPVVAPAPQPVTPPAVEESLVQAAIRRKVPVGLLVALKLYAQTVPEGLTPDEIIDLFNAGNANPEPAKVQKGNEAPGRGTFPVGKLTANDRVYVREQALSYSLAKQNGDLWRDAFAGTHDEIRTAIHLADIDRRWPIPAADTPEVAEAVVKAFQNAKW
jgi:hypothetical protein